MKAKLGITTGALAAIAFFASFIGGIVPLAIVAGYILIAEEDVWLRKMAVKAVTFTVIMSLISFVISLIPTFFGLFNDVIDIFPNTIYFYPSFISSIISIAQTVISLVKSVALIVLGIQAFGNSTLPIPGVDSIVDKIVK